MKICEINKGVKSTQSLALLRARLVNSHRLQNSLIGFIEEVSAYATTNIHCAIRARKADGKTVVNKHADRGFYFDTLLVGQVDGIRLAGD